MAFALKRKKLRYAIEQRDQNQTTFHYRKDVYKIDVLLDFSLILIIKFTGFNSSISKAIREKIEYPIQNPEKTVWK